MNQDIVHINSGANNWPIDLLLLSSVFLFDRCLVVLEYAGNVYLLEDLNAVWDLGGQTLIC